MTRLGDYDIGQGPDAAELTLGGEVVGNFLAYEVTCAVFDTPGRFAVTLGWADKARELIARYPKRTPFTLAIGGLDVLTGYVDGRSIPSSGYTTLVLRGRDRTALLENHYLDGERSFSESTYYQLTERLLGELETDFTLTGNNTANRKAITGANVVVTKASRVTEEMTIEAVGSGTSQVVRKTLKMELGETCIGFLERQYKRVGLFLWCAGDGSFVLSEPNPNQEPLYQLVRERETITPATNVESVEWNDDAAQRHALSVIRGRGGGTRAGRVKVTADFADAELVGLGYRNTIVAHDEDIRTRKEAEYAARRRNAEERRQGWTLKYTVTGHTAPHFDGSGQRVLWAPDTVVMVRDEELGIEGPHYVDSVTFTKSKDGTRTQIELTRPEDLVFAEEITP